MTTPQTVMPLEDVMPWLLKLREHFSGRVDYQLHQSKFSNKDDDRKWWEEQARLEKSTILDPIDAALHHLEAGSRGCQCDMVKHYAHSALGGVFLGELEDAVHFCPWCGGKLTTSTSKHQG